MSRRWSIVLIVAGIALAASVAEGVRAPEQLRGEQGFVAAGQTPARMYRDVTWHTPHARTEAAWNHFLTLYGPDWTAFWDDATGVPQRIFGAGVEMPGSVASAQLAEAFARDVLREHIDLLAPGASPDDFALAANDLSGGLRSVGFVQRHDGMRVLGGQLSFRFKNDRLFVIASVAYPDVDAPTATSPIGDGVARAEAGAWIADLFQTEPRVGDVSDPFVLPIVYATGDIAYRTVVSVRVDSDDPIGRWDVYLDANTGEAVGRKQLLMFATGTVTVHAPERWWGWDYLDYPAYGTSVTAGGTGTVTDEAGMLSWSGDAAAEVTIRATGPLVSVSNSGGSDISHTFTLEPGGTYVWNESDSEFSDAQVTSYIHGHRVKQWASRVSGIAWLDDTLPVNVNINQNCNAFSDGTTINFYRAGGGCGNTGRIADIVYHEFGHSIHNHSLISGVGSWDGALSEGLGDFVGATITGDPKMGRGFFNDESPLRDCDPEDHEQVWPDDRGEIHYTGQIYCGAMFDLRKNLVASLGEDEGVATTNTLFYESYRRADDIPSTYVELLAWDDDDGNLSNGTPHQCEIDEAYARHGMADPDGPVGPRVRPPVADGLHVSVGVLSAEACPNGAVNGATLDWQLRDDPNERGTIEMALVDDAYEAEIPRPPWGSVVNYKVTVEQVTGELHTYPSNPADPMYEMFIGEATVLYCTDFETDPAADGWAHGLSRGEATEGADDWQWGRPLGKAGDPGGAYSGDQVYGNDLGDEGFNGEYQSDKTNWTTSPIVDTQGYEVVRLQYRRWLSIEDGSADKATIYGNDTALWANLADGATDHLDGEWRFHDVDLTDTVADGKVQVKFELDTDGGDTFGGWNLDDVCIVAYNNPVCGNALVEGYEECDDGNTDNADACLDDCTVNPDSGGDGGDDDDDDGSGGVGGVHSGCGCSTDSDPAQGASWLIALALLALRRRRRAGGA